MINLRTRASLVFPIPKQHFFFTAISGSSKTGITGSGNCHTKYLNIYLYDLYLVIYNLSVFMIFMRIVVKL